MTSNPSVFCTGIGSRSSVLPYSMHGSVSPVRMPATELARFSKEIAVSIFNQDGKNVEKSLP